MQGDTVGMEWTEDGGMHRRCICVDGITNLHHIRNMEERFVRGDGHADVVLCPPGINSALRIKGFGDHHMLGVGNHAMERTPSLFGECS